MSEVCQDGKAGRGVVGDRGAKCPADVSSFTSMVSASHYFQKLGIQPVERLCEMPHLQIERDVLGEYHLSIHMMTHLPHHRGPYVMSSIDKSQQ